MYVSIIVTLFNVLAAIISGPTGFGMSTITTPFLVAYFNPQEVLLFTGLTHSIGSMWVLYFLKKECKMSLVFLFGIPMFLGSFVGSRLSFTLPTYYLLKGMGAFLIGYVFFVRWYIDYRLPAYRPTALIGGFISGFTAGLFGFGGAIRTVFLKSFAMSHQQFIVMSHVFELIIDGTRSLQYLWQGTTLSPDLYGAFLLAPFTLIIGAFVVKYALHHFDQQYFEHLVSIALLLEGIRLLFFM